MFFKAVFALCLIAVALAAPAPAPAATGARPKNGDW